MKPLQSVDPTPEQMKLMILPRPGIKVVRGAAGSGKTTTAVLMMNLSIGYLLDYFSDQGNNEPINIRIFTFNRTLAAYITNLVEHEQSKYPDDRYRLNINVTTLSSYMRGLLKKNIAINILSLSTQANIIKNMCHDFPVSSQFIVDEVEYLMGRLHTNNLEEYIELERTGRGTKPRIDKHLRRRILDEVVYEYIKYKKTNNYIDWNDLAISLSEKKCENIHVTIIDEAQDFSANQLKAIVKQLSDVNFMTIVLDSNQKIYKRGFTWKEVGISGASYSRLELNYRNTVEIANLATKFLQNAKVVIDDDGTLPILEEITRHGKLPIIVEGYFSKQLNFIIDYIKNNINLQEETIGFLHAKGGDWFNEIRYELNRHHLQYIKITGENTWPDTNINIALSTIHSSKGLEFDYVFLVGLEDRHFSFTSTDPDDVDYISALKLFSMGITRAKENVIITYKKDTKPLFLSNLDKTTYEMVIV